MGQGPSAAAARLSPEAPGVQQRASRSRGSSGTSSRSSGGGGGRRRRADSDGRLSASSDWSYWSRESSSGGGGGGPMLQRGQSVSLERSRSAGGSGGSGARSQQQQQQQQQRQQQMLQMSAAEREQQRRAEKVAHELSRRERVQLMHDEIMRKPPLRVFVDGATQTVRASDSWAAFMLCWGRPFLQRTTSVAKLAVLCVLLLYVAFMGLMVISPTAQSLLVYCHWFKWPYHIGLSDFQSLRLHGARSISIPTVDGEVLGGWHVLPMGAASSIRAAENYAREYEESALQDAEEQLFDDLLRSSDRPIILYFHGNAGTRGVPNRVNLIKDMTGHLQAHVIAVDYRGFADSTGWPSADGVLRDARATLHWLETRLAPPDRLHKDSDLSSGPPDSAGSEDDDTGVCIPSAGGKSRIYLYGQSLGTSVVTRFARELSLQCRPPQGIILDAPFATLRGAAESHFLAAPFRLIPGATSFLHEDLPSDEWIRNVTCDVLILHGQQDWKVPFEQGYQLYRSAKDALLEDAQHTVRLATFPHSGHDDIYASEQWLVEMQRFFEHLSTSTGSGGGSSTSGE